jgi:GDPmannose 4,6-dehydratase
MSRAKLALISGITGQTGAYLAHYLLSLGYSIIGGSRDADSANLSRLEALKILDKVKIVSLAPADFRSVIQVVSLYQPDEIYSLAGQTSVGLSFEQPFEAFESIATSTLNFLEAIRILNLPIRFFNAGSTECFGESLGQIISEDSPMQPTSPYAVAKSTSYWITSNYRKSYDIFACTGFLSNHESPLRPQRFVISKIVHSVHQIKLGYKKYIELGNLCISRDWGWASDYVKAIHMMATASSPRDYIIATGKSYSLLSFVESICQLAGLQPDKILKTDSSLLRPADLGNVLLSPERINSELGWYATTEFPEIVEKLYYNQLF